MTVHDICGVHSVNLARDTNLRARGNAVTENLEMSPNYRHIPSFLGIVTGNDTDPPKREMLFMLPNLREGPAPMSHLLSINQRPDLIRCFTRQPGRSL
jgi:hypothetical protein